VLLQANSAHHPLTRIVLAQTARVLLFVALMVVVFATAMYALLLAIGSLFLLWLGYYAFVDRMRGVPYPPGPKPIPFAGNVHQLPKTDFFKTYSSWAKVYGPIVYFYVFGRKFVVLSDLDVVQDLLAKRSGKYSTRPHLTMGTELVGRGQNSVVFLKYGQRLRDVRRIINTWVGKNVVESTYPTVLLFNRKLLRSLLDTPDDFHAHLKFKFGSLVFKLTYGIDVQSIHDPYIALTEEMNRRTSMAIAPGRWLCDSFPIRV